jgi:hypothetical protein
MIKTDMMKDTKIFVNSNQSPESVVESSGELESFEQS